MRIFKYPLEKRDCVLMMPQGAEVLHVGLQRDVPHIWALVDPDQRRSPRRFTTYGTGVEVPEGGYLGTFLVGRTGNGTVEHYSDVSIVAVTA